MLKVSLVGCGGIAGVHSQVIAKAAGEDVQFLSCCDEKFERAQKMAEQFGCKAYRSLKELIEAEKPDVVHVATPHYTHVPLVLYALRHGIHVLTEKPAASALSDIEILVSAAEQADKQVGVCFQNRYNSSSQFARQFVDSGKGGKLLGARAFVNWDRQADYYAASDWRGSVNTEGSSVLLNQSIHTVDLVQWLVGDPVSIEGHVANYTHKDLINTEDTAEACIRFANGVNALFFASVSYCANATISVEIIFEKVTMVILGEEITLTYDDGTVETPALAQTLDSLGKSYWGAGHEHLIMDFYAHIKKGEKFPIDAREGCRALKTCFKIIESGKNGVNVEY